MSADALDLAVLNALNADATLATLAPGGVWKDAAPAGVVDAAVDDASKVFGIVTLQSALDAHEFGDGRRPALEECRYLVKFVCPSTNPTGAQAALDRSLEVLPTVTATGYRVSASRREERINYVEVDGDIRWQHRGVSWFLAASQVSA